MANFDLGVLGGGQLARMTIQAAQRMGLSCLSIDAAEKTPASQIAPAIQGRLDDPDSLASVFAQCAVVTLENEFVPVRAVRKAMQKAGRAESSLVPGPETLGVIQDKFLQRQALETAGVPSPEAVPLDGDGSLAVSKLGYPLVLKARFGGYDGRGTRYARNEEEFQIHANLWQGQGGWMAERYVPFRRELAVIVYRHPLGSGCFPTVETIQKDHVCDVVFPSTVDATPIAMQAIDAVEGVGLFGVELFELEDGSLQVNEIAPRPHNSGHYTLDWGGASQFDQAVRLALGLPPLPLDGVPAAMANILGQKDAGEWRRGLVAVLRADPGIRFHWYGKQEVKKGRKMGHLNAVGPDALERVRAAREVFYNNWVQVTAEGG